MRELPAQRLHYQREAEPFIGPQAVAPSLLEVLWRRRGLILVTIFAFIASAVLYLFLVPPTYVAKAKLVVSPGSVGAFAGRQTYVDSPSGFVETQRDVLRSHPVLSRAVRSLGDSLKTLESGGADPVNWLQNGGLFDVDVPSKSDVIVVSMESHYAAEATVLVDAVVSAYVAETAERSQSLAEEAVKALNEKRSRLRAKREESTAAMVKLQRDEGVLSFDAGGRGNVVLDRATTLAAALAAAEQATADLKSQRRAMEAALEDPQAASAFVQALQYRSRDAGDREYDDLLIQLTQQQLAMASFMEIQGRNHPTVHILQARIDALKERIAQKERRIIEAQKLSLESQLGAAEERERQARAAAEAQRTKAVDLNQSAAQYAALDVDIRRLDRQMEALDARIEELTVDPGMAGATKIEVLERAQAAATPVKPKKTLTLLAALVVGWILGAGLAVLRELRDPQIRTAEEASTACGAPMLAVVPRMSLDLAPTERGQALHIDPCSPAAEAYRSVRTSLSARSSGDLRTVLIASPSPGDGKSTTAANLAIALAHAGYSTLLLDCDQRQPVQHIIFDQGGESDDHAGLSSVLAGEMRLRGAVRSTAVPGLHLLPCGPIPANPSELLAGKRFERILQSLAKSFDRIVIDSPPLSSVSDARSLAILADATVLVVRVNHTSRQSVAEAMDAIERAGVEVAGVVVNDVPFARDRRRQYSYETAWHYASTTGRLPRMPPGMGELRRGLRAEAETRRPVLLIDEPDWSDEGHPSSNGAPRAAAEIAPAADL